MSFTVFGHNERLEKIISDAADKGIVMMCSNHDGGANHNKSFPADYSHTWVVTACDEYGFAPHMTDSARATDKLNTVIDYYMFQTQRCCGCDSLPRLH